MAIEVLAPRDVHTTLNYLQPPDQILYYYVTREPPDGVPAHNVSNKPHSAVIRDARSNQDAFGLDIRGFHWLYHQNVEKEMIETVYYAEVENILKKHTRVVIFDHTIRRSSNPETGPVRLTNRGPAHLVHADQPFTSAEQKVRNLLPEEAERLLKGRYQVVNVWRPIANKVAHNSTWRRRLSFRRHRCGFGSGTLVFDRE